MLIEAALLDAGDEIEVVRADRLQAGIELLAYVDVDLILLDLSLPDTQGLETILRMRQYAGEIPIVVLTGLDDDEFAVRAVGEGAQDYLSKRRLEGAALLRAIRYAVERQRAVGQLRRLAVVDELTGLTNRRGFVALAQQQAKIALRDQKPFTVLFIDLNNMKRINDTFGHNEGDRALLDTASVLRHTFRESDIVARMGGDEFCVLLIESNDDEHGVALKRLQHVVDEHNVANERPYKLSLSVGSARYDPLAPCSVEELIEQADQAMYAEKTKAAERPQLLLVDDDHSIRLLGEVLFGDDYDVLTGSTGKEAIERAEQEQPDLVLLDLSLPDMSGVEVAQRLRESNETASIPIIMVTGSGDDLSEVHSLESGVDDYVTKPFNEHALKARMANLLKRARRR